MTSTLLPVGTYDFSAMEAGWVSALWDEPYRVLVTGWRDWPKEHDLYIWEKIELHITTAYGRRLRQPVVIVHGACPFGGVDLWAHQWAQTCEVAVPEPVPAEWNPRGILLGPARNLKMVKRGADVCLGFPSPNSRGTTDCMNKARAAGINTFEYPWSEVNGLSSM